MAPRLDFYSEVRKCFFRWEAAIIPNIFGFGVWHITKVRSAIRQLPIFNAILSIQLERNDPNYISSPNYTYHKRWALFHSFPFTEFTNSDHRMHTLTKQFHLFIQIQNVQFTNAIWLATCNNVIKSIKINVVCHYGILNLKKKEINVQSPDAISGISQRRSSSHRHLNKRTNHSMQIAIPYLEC